MKRYKILEVLKSPVRILIGFPDMIKVCHEESYSPEEERKSLASRITDNVIWLFKNWEPNRFYNLYGFDIKANKGKEKNYINYLKFFHMRDENNLLREVNSQTVLLRDKFMFYEFMSYKAFPVPKVFAVLINGKLYNSDMEEINDSYLESYENYFVKEMYGECASFVKHIHNYKDFQANKTEIAKHSCIFQYAIAQDAQMAAINPNAINTLRIVTIFKNGKPYVFSKLLRVGTEKTGNVDNWAKGGLAIGINDNGYLKKYGYYKPHFGSKADTHPDSHIVFNEFKVPMFEEACELACEAHKQFYNIKSIGWDIAITPDGPVFIEGNDNWEISLHQVVDDGLKEEWEKAMSD